MVWVKSWRTDPRARCLADRHYSRQSPGSLNFVPPGSCLVLYALTVTGEAYWVTSNPYREYVKHAWGGSWICSAFRNEGAGLSSELIRQAIAATRFAYGVVPDIGMITFIDPKKIKHKRDPGRCFRKAGFKTAVCPVHEIKVGACEACHGRTKSGLLALQMFESDMPDPEAPGNWQLNLFSA